MEFDVFEKLSELETEIHILKKELEEKDAFIQNLMDKNTDLERRLLSLDHQGSLLGDNLQNNKTTTTSSLNATDSKTYGTSIANMLKETSDAVVRNTGYTFDERTGLYYDHKSGYYYDPENQLFYEPKTGTYYKYNSETGEYTNYIASEDDSTNNKFREFSHPIYAHLLKKMEQHRRADESDYGRQSKIISRRSRSISSDAGYRRRRRRHSRSGSQYSRSHHKYGCRSPSIHERSSRRRKSYRRSRRCCSSDSDKSRYNRSKHRRKHSHRHRHRSSSTTGSVCSYNSRSEFM
ncbi:Angiogenic factor with G patch and FHA domains 1 [Schistosoma japonicum]|uniref:Angiogenic factor with G patch and FHA domains 1 n=1 Tax=Schistosoma japonicum TaxID=6182 RepID=A0A4Z2DXR4_SCHJA|nr:Angiogenic factor with G patch and FHA domains 1 [Schistosoma japonicum]TNN21294.1 Angiogenic factor with G patch and FHA domains 1 [Schistosoma japonicum]